MRLISQWLRGVIGFIALAALAACDQKMTSPSMGGARLRVVNAAPAAVDVLIDGTVVLQALGGRSVSPMIAIDAGARSMELRPSGTTTNATQVAITAESGHTVTLLSTPTATAAVHLDVVLDTGATPAAGMSKLRVLHLAASVPILAVWRTQPDYSTPISVMFPFAYRAASPFLQSTPGGWEVRVWADSMGTGQATATANWTHALAGLTVDIPAGTARTIVVMDAASGVQLQLLPEN